VDVYVNPNEPPTGVNQPWPDLGRQGLAWGVTSDALPLSPGQTLTLRVNDSYYVQASSNVSWPLPAGTPIYAQVDSVNFETDYGAVRETHEVNGQAYNNITTAASTAGTTVWGTASVVPENRFTDWLALPERIR
jgi:hypothetical protein